MKPNVQSVATLKVSSGISSVEPDLVVTEEPLEIRVGYGRENAREQFTLSVTMRTPGHDQELCIGFLYTEGIIQRKEDVLRAEYCIDQQLPDAKENVMRVELAPEVEFNPSRFSRNFYTASSCGVCGKASIESLTITCQTLKNIDTIITSSILYNLPAKLQGSQPVFEHTGGLHASALFNLSGKILYLREDVGRHNALDKLVGSLLLNGVLPANDTVLLLSGRISFDLIQKAVRAGIPIVAAVGAPSSLAIKLAVEYGVTLVGFLKDDKFNIYTERHRVNI
jgi:FdhD protein